MDDNPNRLGLSIDAPPSMAASSNTEFPLCKMQGS